MIFSINRNKLVEILSDFNNILKENPIKPIISGLKIEALDNRIIFTGTNLEINFIKTSEGDIEENGVVILKPFLALEYIKLLDDEFIKFSLNKETLMIHGAEFLVLDSEQYPEVEEIKFTEISKINSSKFVKLLDKTKFAAATSNENMAINCLRIIFKNNEIQIASTDSYRLIFLSSEAESSIEKEFSLPLESVNIICKLLKDSNEDITIGYNDNLIIFKWSNSYFSSKAINLPFPSFSGILSNSSFSKEMEFNTIELKSALKKVLTVARTSVETKNGALLNFAGKNLVMSAHSGKAKINQKVNMIKNGDDLKCSLNIKYLYEFIDNISKNSIIKCSSSSAMFEISEYENNSYKYILMPLALRD